MHLIAPSSPDVGSAAPAAQLVRDTLALVNSHAYVTATPSHAQMFFDVTGVEQASSSLRILEMLNGRDGIATGAVAQHLGMTVSAMSRAVGYLDESGCISRTADPADSRRSLLSLHPDWQPVMNRWLSRWIDGYLSHTEGWTDSDAADLAEWFEMVHGCLAELHATELDRSAARTWRDSSEWQQLTPSFRELGESIITLFAWVGQTRWFDVLLRDAGAELGHQVYFTLRVVGQRGPISVAETAERTGVDHSQASKRVKRLVELGLVERGVDSFDRRSYLVRSTRRGRDLEAAVVGTQFTSVHDAMRARSTADRIDRWAHVFDRYVRSFGRTGALLDI